MFPVQPDTENEILGREEKESYDVWMFEQNSL